MSKGRISKEFQASDILCRSTAFPLNIKEGADRTGRYLEVMPVRPETRPYFSHIYAFTTVSQCEDIDDNSHIRNFISHSVMDTEQEPLNHRLSPPSETKLSGQFSATTGASMPSNSVSYQNPLRSSQPTRTRGFKRSRIRVKPSKSDCKAMLSVEAITSGPLAGLPLA